MSNCVVRGVVCDPSDIDFSDRGLGGVADARDMELAGVWYTVPFDSSSSLAMDLNKDSFSNSGLIYVSP